MKKIPILFIAMRKTFNTITPAAITLLFCLNSNAQQKVIQLYNGLPPGSEDWTWTEQETIKNPMNTKLVYNITQATLTAFIPDASKNNGTAVIVCPLCLFRFMVSLQIPFVSQEHSRTHRPCLLRLLLTMNWFLLPIVSFYIMTGYNPNNR